MRPNCLKFLTSIAMVGLIAACQDAPTAVSTLEGPLLRATPASSIPFSGYMYSCDFAFGDEWVTPGGVFHFDGSTAINEWVTGNPLIDGIEQNIELGGMANANGTLTVRYEATITPNAVDGTWETSTYQLQLNATRFGGAKGVAHGTGDLAGMTMRFTLVPDFTMTPPETACDPDFPFVFVLEGTIHEAASH